MIDRYGLPRMTKLWSAETKYRKWLEVEVLAAEAWAKLGVIPEEAASAIKHRARIDPVRIAELEKEMRHDVAAFVAQVAESVGEFGKYVHYGLTSYDVVDTALSALMRDACDIILEDLARLAEVLASKASEHAHTLMMGRTHGIWAEPVTFGLKLAVWHSQVQRDIQRVKQAREAVAVGRLSGVVGTYAHIDPYVERYVCEKMGLKPAPVSTQVLQRDRHAQYMCALALVGSSVESFALEIRSLQRSEIGEVEEPFRAGQKGSSAMPHKKNPVTCEQMCGLARVVRANALAAMENIALWNERDISHSSVERIVLPDSSILVDYMLNTFTEVVANLRVFPQRMLENIRRSNGLFHSQRVMLELIERGLTREEAYRLVQELAQVAMERGEDLRELLKRDPRVLAVLSPEDLEKCFDLGYYLRKIDGVLGRAGLGL